MNTDADLMHTYPYERRNNILFFISNFRRVLNAVCFLLRNSAASEFYIPTFRNTVSSIFIPPAYEDGTDRVFRNVGI